MLMFCSWRGDILAGPLVKSVKTPGSAGAFLEVFPTPNTYVPVTPSCASPRPLAHVHAPGRSRAPGLLWGCTLPPPGALSRHRLPLRSGSVPLRHRDEERVGVGSRRRQAWSVPRTLPVPGQRWPWHWAGPAAAGRQVVVQGIFAEPGFELNWGQAQPKPNRGSSRKACETRQSLRLRCGMNNSLIYKVGRITLP